MRKNFPHRKKERQEQAAVRQAEYDASTTQTKIENCHSRRGNSRRELDYLHHGRRLPREKYRENRTNPLSAG